jgi:hypothetical protein
MCGDNGKHMELCRDIDHNSIMLNSNTPEDDTKNTKIRYTQWKWHKINSIITQPNLQNERLIKIQHPIKCG